MMHNVRDNLHSLKNFTTITSGSYGEGIEMRGSDLDVMYVSMDVEICEDTNIYFKPDTTYFIIEAEDTKPGFSQLRLVHMANDDLNFVEYCDEIGDQISNFLELAYLLPREPSLLNVDIRKQLFPLNMWVADCLFTNTDFKAEEGIRPILSIESSKIKSIYSYYTSKFSFRSQSLLQSNDLYGNKSTYSQYKTCVSTLLQSTRHDAVSGWLLLASFFYKTKHYNTALNILQYSLLKCSPEKLYVRSELSPSQYELLNLNVFKNMTIFQIWKFLLMNLIAFPRNSMLIPSEIQIEAKGRLAKIPPVVYAHCLRFLCHYHLNNTRKYRDSLRDLQLTIEQDYFIPCDCWKAASYNILGTSFQLVKDIESARHSFMQSMLLLPDPNINNAFQKFSLLD
ncbi:unnamed protein product [Mytilus coruscus]|uniref:Uncharacterized protein n=1 Tax=Mytilus coruscus TaxID=42192 RepID=A0A6J8F002_MYTCO|nr:unnamed protein product [Mytilus coruscus]